MANINKVYATLCLIRHALLPGEWHGHGVMPAADNSVTTIEPACFAVAMKQPDAFLRRDGTMQLLFAAALAPAAPFVLFRLKRRGFSGCCAEVVPEGILLTATR